MPWSFCSFFDTWELSQYLVVTNVCMHIRNCLKSVGTIVVQQKVTKTAWMSFSLRTSSLNKWKQPFSAVWCLLCMATSNIWSSSENINNTAGVSKLSFRFLWLWLNLLSLNCYNLQHLLWSFLIDKTFIGKVFTWEMF